MNWYKCIVKISNQYQKLLEDVLQEDQYHDIFNEYQQKGISKLPPGYDVVKLPTGEWTVLTPAEYAGQPIHERSQIVRQEHVYKRNEKGELELATDEEAREYIIRSALDRIRFRLAFSLGLIKLYN